MSFGKFDQNYDPNEDKDYTFPFTLADGETIATQTVTVVDAQDNPLATDLTIYNVTSGPIDDGSGRQGVTCWVRGQAPLGKYFLRSRIVTSNNRKFDYTLVLTCKQN